MAQPATSSPKPQPVSSATGLDGWLRLEQAIHETSRDDELNFALANETHGVVPFYQSVVWSLDWRGAVEVDAVSGVTALDRNTTALRQVRKIVRALARQYPDGSPVALDADTLDAQLGERWLTWFPRYGFWQPLRGRDGRVRGGLVLTRDTPFTETEQQSVGALSVLVERQRTWLATRPRRARLAALKNQRVAAGAALAVLALSLLVRVPATAVGHAQIAPLDPLLVTASVDGVVQGFHVRPGDTVTEGQALFSLRDDELKSQADLARKTMLVAVADFEHARRRSLTAQREGKDAERYRLIVEQRRAELDLAESRLKRATVTSPGAGVVVLKDPQTWLGKPVSTGERILSIADPGRVRAEVWIPVGDVSMLKADARVVLYLDSRPGESMSARVAWHDYEPELSPRGVLAQRAVAELEAPADAADTPAPGATGTARVYGERTSLLWYVLRRPLGRLRQFWI